MKQSQKERESTRTREERGKKCLLMTPQHNKLYWTQSDPIRHTKIPPNPLPNNNFELSATQLCNWPSLPFIFGQLFQWIQMKYGNGWMAFGVLCHFNWPILCFACCQPWRWLQPWNMIWCTVRCSSFKSGFGWNAQLWIYRCHSLIRG